MILGLGNDLANIERVAGVLDRYGERFRDRVFTEIEQARAERLAARAPSPGKARLVRAASYAKRWAAKEACSKALGTGLRMGIAWRDMGVVNLPGGQPTLRLEGWAAARLAEMTPAGWEARLHVSLTDDHPWAEAVVTIEALPPGLDPRTSVPAR